MKIREYFKTAKGRGVLATADSSGKVDVAIYALPHVIDEGTIAFIMTDKLTHQNLQSNPHAAYLFTEEE
jgi:pyridoxine/pyridoxamine 5'-phosphate oxidase